MPIIIRETIQAKGVDITIYTEDFQNEFISLTDIARYKSDEPKDVIKNWMRNKDTIEFLVFGSNYIMTDLKGSNSTPLESKQVQMLLHCLRRSG